MYSPGYYQVVEKVKIFHRQNKTYSGGGTLAYADEIKKLAEIYNPKSLLDYGCGKGLQYEENSIITFGEQKVTFDKFIGVESVYKFDPGVDEFETPPNPTSKFDAVIAIQSLTGIPDVDFPIVVKELMAMTNKFCFIGNKISPGKTKKATTGPDTTGLFIEDRLNPDWWIEQFKDWQGSELVLKFT